MSPLFPIHRWLAGIMPLVFCASLTPQTSRSWVADEFSEARDADRQGQYLEAIARYERILRREPRIAEAYSNLGLDYYLLKDYGHAVTDLKKALEIEPDLLSARLFLGLAEFRLSHFEQSAEHLRAVLKADPRNHDAYLFLIRSQMGLGRLDLDVAGRALGIFPKDVELNYAVGLAALERIREIADYAKKLGSQSPIFQWMTLRLDEEKNEPRNTERDREQLQRLGATNPPAIIREYDAAVSMVGRCFETILETAPDSTYGHSVQGHIYEAQDHVQEALTEYRKAADHFALGCLLAQHLHLAEAAAELEIAIANEPENRLAAAELAQVYVQNHLADKAIPILKELLQQYPHDAFAWADLGKAQVTAGQLEQGIHSLHTAVQLDPMMNNLHYELAMAYRKSGQARLAEEEIEKFRSGQKGTR